MSSVTHVSPQHHAHKVAAPPVKQAGVDSDGDNDGSKSGEVEAKQPPKPVSAAIGNNINTTA
jgi:hypothetical protein